MLAVPATPISYVANFRSVLVSGAPLRPVVSHQVCHIAQAILAHLGRLFSFNSEPDISFADVFASLAIGRFANSGNPPNQSCARGTAPPVVTPCVRPVFAIITTDTCRAGTRTNATAPTRLCLSFRPPPAPRRCRPDACCEFLRFLDYHRCPDPPYDTTPDFLVWRDLLSGPRVFPTRFPPSPEDVSAIVSDGPQGPQGYR